MIVSEMHQPQETTTPVIANIKTEDITHQLLPAEQLFPSKKKQRLTKLLTRMKIAQKTKTPTILKPYAQVEAISPQEKLIAQPPKSLRANIETLSKGYSWSDEYGIPYGAMVTKGNVFTNFKILEDDNEPSGYKIYGLDSGLYSLPHRIKASQVVRQLGLPTERYTRVEVIKEFIKDGRRIKIEEFKRELLSDIQKQKKLTPQELTSIENFLRNLPDFIITHRDVQTAFRLADIAYLTDTKQLIEEMQEFGGWLNHQHQEDKDFQPFNFITKTESGALELNKPEIKRYFTNWYPMMMAKYLAKLHQAGISHGFAHEQNWQLYPALVDLDSSKGEPLGTAPVTEDQLKNDACTSFNAFKVFDIARGGPLSSLNKYGAIDVTSAQTLFGYVYLIERGIITMEMSEQQMIDVFLNFFQKTNITDKFAIIRSQLEDLHRRYRQQATIFKNPA